MQGTGIQRGYGDRGHNSFRLARRSDKKGIRNAQPVGRVEKFTALGRQYVLDGSHNPAAFMPLCDFLKSVPRSETTVIFGCLKDKDIDGNLAALAGLAEKIIAVKCPSPRARCVQETVAACKKYFGDVGSADSVADALDKAYTKTVVVCGSFTLLREAKLWIEKRR